MIQKNLLKILFVEDVPSDVDLAVIELRKEKIKFEFTTVCTRKDLLKALAEFKPDIIISDYMMPAFNGLQALKATKEFNPDLPFILYTGSVNEETAVECIKAGAKDYVIKEHSARLPFAVKEALEQVYINSEKRASELLLKENEQKLQSIFSAAPVGIGLEVNMVLIEVNDTFCSMVQYRRKEIIGKSPKILYESEKDFLIAREQLLQQIITGGKGSVETKIKRKDGKILDVIFSLAPLDKNDHSNGFTFTVLDITDRKEAEDELRETHRSVKTLISNLHGLVYRCRKDKYYTMEFLSEGARHLTGYPPEDLLLNSKISYSDLIHKDDRDFVFAEVNSAIKNKKHYKITYRIVTKSGETKWVWEKGEGIFNPKGKLEYLEGFITDITERKDMEEALSRSQKLFETLAKTSPVGIFRTQSDGFTTYVNPKWLELSGLSYEEALGFGWLKAVHPDDKEALAGKWQKDVQLKITSIAEYRFLKPDGTIRWVIGNAVPEMAGNEVTGYIGTITDITDHKKSEEAITASERKYRSIFENVQDVYYETLIDGTILEVSPSISILSKGLYQMDDLIGKSMFDFYSDPIERQTILTELNNKGTIADFEITLKNRDGSTVPCSISAKLVFDTNLNPAKIIGSLHDITDRKNVTEALKLAKEKAEASDKLKTDFLNNISHEVRTPLNGILGFAEIISIQGLSEEEKKDSMAMLFESSNRLLNTITNYMDISLITSGSLSVNSKNMNPALLLKKIYDNFEHLCQNKRLEFTLQIPENYDNYVINSDPEILQKILSHFMDNAVKFTERGSVQLGFNVKEGGIEFFVRDTGIGINQDSFDIIFNMFMKEDHSSYRVLEGSGLGLSIAQGMSDAIGAKVRLESEPGVGSSFFLTIPLKTGTKLSSPGNTVIDSINTAKRSTILVAEDDDTNFYYLNALITRETEAEVLHASNGREAIELFKANRDIALILMDMKMPEIDGFEATRQIKLINPNVHIIAITAYAMSGDEERTMAAGCDGYLSKPINKKSLMDKISEFIHKR
jgi:PAS domain S-box-containing protein